jgi:hypothetical protein
MKSSTILREIRLEQGMTICQLADLGAVYTATPFNGSKQGAASLYRIYRSMLAVLGYEIEIMEME